MLNTVPLLANTKLLVRNVTSLDLHLAFYNKEGTE